MLITRMIQRSSLTRSVQRFSNLNLKRCAHSDVSNLVDTDAGNEIRRSIRALCAKYPGSYWRKLEKESLYPTEFVDELSKSGYLSLLIPTEYGGSGLSIWEACIALQEIQRSGCNSGAAHAQMYTMGTLLRFGTDEQKNQFLPKIAAGELRLQAFGVSEPNSGTDTLSLETTATRLGDKYIIQGQKIWTSRAQHSDMMLLLARTAASDSAPRSKSLSLFLVDMKAAIEQGNMTIKTIDTMINHSTCQVYFDNLEIPATNLLGDEGDGLKCVLSSMNAERILIAAECIGDARFFLDRGTAYANERHVFGRPIGQNQGIQFPLARAYASTEAADLMVQSAAAKYIAGEPGSEKKVGELANMAKMLASEASWEAGEACMQTYGGFAFAREYDIERKWREARLYRTAPISTNLILAFIGEKVLGLPRSY